MDDAENEVIVQELVDVVAGVDDDFIPAVAPVEVIGRVNEIVAPEMSLILRSGEFNDDEVRKLRDMAVTAMKVQKTTYIVIAAILTRFHEGKLYRKLGHDTWEDFLSQPELDIAPPTAYRYMSVYRIGTTAGVTVQEMEDVGFSKMEIIKEHLTPDTKDGLINQAKSLQMTDLKKVVATTPTREELEAGDGPLPVVRTKTFTRIELTRIILPNRKPRYTLIVTRGEKDGEDRVMGVKKETFTSEEFQIDRDGGNVQINLVLPVEAPPPMAPVPVDLGEDEAEKIGAEEPIDEAEAEVPPGIPEGDADPFEDVFGN